MGKVHKTTCENVDKQTLCCRPCSYNTHFIYPSRSKKYHASGFQKYFFPLERIFLQLFSFTLGTFFLGHPVIVPGRGSELNQGWAGLNHGSAEQRLNFSRYQSVSEIMLMTFTDVIVPTNKMFLNPQAIKKLMYTV